MFWPETRKDNNAFKASPNKLCLKPKANMVLLHNFSPYRQNLQNLKPVWATQWKPSIIIIIIWYRYDNHIIPSSKLYYTVIIIIWFRYQNHIIPLSQSYYTVIIIILYRYYNAQQITTHQPKVLSSEIIVNNQNLLGSTFKIEPIRKARKREWKVCFHD